MHYCSTYLAVVDSACCYSISGFSLMAVTVVPILILLLLSLMLLLLLVAVSIVAVVFAGCFRLRCSLLLLLLHGCFPAVA